MTDGEMLFDCKILAMCIKTSISFDKQSKNYANIMTMVSMVKTLKSSTANFASMQILNRLISFAPSDNNFLTSILT